MSETKHDGFDAALERDYVFELLEITDSTEAAKHLRSVARLDPGDLSDPHLPAVLEAIYALSQRGEHTGALSVRMELEKRGKPSEWVTQVLARLRDTGQRISYAPLGVVSEKLKIFAAGRRMTGNMAVAAVAIRDGRLEDAREALLLAAEQQAGTAVRVLNAKQVVEHTLRAKEGRGSTWRCGFQVIDSAVGGFMDQAMVFIGGAQNSGKSMLALNWALNLAAAGHRPGWISTEDPERVLGSRILQQATTLRHSTLVGNQQLDFEGEQEAKRGLVMAESMGIKFAFELNRKLKDVMSACRSLIVDHGCDIIFCDYIQAIRFDLRSERKVAVPHAAQSLNAECQAHNATLVALSQLNRADDSKPFEEPHAGKLKESGDLENMARVIILTWKTGDGEDAISRGKVAKVTWSNKRPRFEFRWRENGALDDLEYWTPDQHTGNGRKPSEKRPW